MKRGLVFAAVSLGWALCVGCGGGRSDSNPTYGTIKSGNWSFKATSSVTSGLVLSIGGALTQSRDVVSGTLSISSSVSNCPFDSGTAVPFSGSFRGNTLTLKSADFSDQFVTVNAVRSGNSLTGTYSVAGGCANGEQGTISAIYLPPITGTWSGPLLSPDGSPIPVDPNDPAKGPATATLTLTQSDTATNGQFPLTGTFDVHFGNICSSSESIPGSDTTAAAYVMGTSVVISSSSAGGGRTQYKGQLEESRPVIGGWIATGTGTCLLHGLLYIQPAQ